jgi:hypothetical protein
VNLRTTENKPTKWQVKVLPDRVCDHFKNLPLSILSFAFVKAIQYNDDWLSRILALEGCKWLQDKLTELDWGRFS